MNAFTKLETTPPTIYLREESGDAEPARLAADKDDVCTKTCACPCAEPCAYVAEILAKRVFTTPTIDLLTKQWAEEDLIGWDEPDRLTPHQRAIMANPEPICPSGKLSAEQIIRACKDIQTWLAHWSALLPITEGEDYHPAVAIRCYALCDVADGAITVVANSPSNSIVALKAKAELFDFMVDRGDYSDKCYLELQASVIADVLALPTFNSPAPDMEGLRANA